jgi:hypothetical protein
MEPQKNKPQLPQSTKYNYEAMRAYNFDNI